MESSDNLNSRHKTFTYYRHDYSMVNISILWDGGGIKILWYNILTPPPLQKYSRTVFVHGIQWQLSLNTQNIYISQTILFHGWHFFLMGCGGAGSIYYGIIYWPPPQWYKGFTTSKQNPMTHLLYHFDHLQVFVDNINVDSSNKVWVGGGQNIMV